MDYLLGPGLMNHLVVPMMKQAEADLARLAGSFSKAHGAHLTAVSSAPASPLKKFVARPGRWVRT